MIEDAVVKSVESENLIGKNYVEKDRTNPGCTNENIVVYIKAIIWGKPDITLVHTGTHDPENRKKQETKWTEKMR